MYTHSLDASAADQARAPEAAAASNVNRDLAGSIRDFFLQIIATEHNSTRALIRSVTPDKLDFQPRPAAKTMSELMWYLVQTEHHALAGICDGKFEPLPKTPEHKGSDAVLAWDDGHFSDDFRRLMELSGDDLLRPVRFAGATLPAFRYLPLYLGLIQQFRGQLILYLALAPASAESLDSARIAGRASAEIEEGELSEADLAAVAGGGGSSGSVVMVSGNQVPAGFTTVVVCTTPSPTQLAQLAQIEAAQNGPIGGLGTLFATGDPQITQIEGYLVGAAFAVTGAVAGVGLVGTAYDAVSTAVGFANSVGDAIGNAAVAGAQVTASAVGNLAAPGLQIAVPFTLGGAAAEGATVAGQKT